MSSGRAPAGRRATSTADDVVEVDGPRDPAMARPGQQQEVVDDRLEAQALALHDVGQLGHVGRPGVGYRDLGVLAQRAHRGAQP